MVVETHSLGFDSFQYLDSLAFRIGHIQSVVEDLQESSIVVPIMLGSNDVVKAIPMSTMEFHIDHTSFIECIFSIRINEFGFHLNILIIRAVATSAIANSIRPRTIISKLNPWLVLIAMVVVFTKSIIIGNS